MTISPAFPSVLAWLLNPLTWYTVALGMFLGVFLKFAGRPVGKAIDSRIESVRYELDEAQRLRAEALALLESARVEETEAHARTQALRTEAEQEIARIRTEAEANLEQTLRRREVQANDRIRLMIEDAERTVYATLRDRALAEAQRTLAERLTPAQADAVVDRALDDLPRLLEAAPRRG